MKPFGRRRKARAGAFRLALAALLAAALPAARSAASPPSAKPAGRAVAKAAAPATLTGGLHFTDVTAQAGIRFVHESGRAGKKYLPETLGAGVAAFDADGDGWLDLFFVNSRKWTKGKGGKPALPALYLNRRDGTFRDATRGSGLDVELYGLGAAAGDYDNDGRDDLY
ncbi:MAG TPA: VCBS repeat-containing protein, partial [Thermoanaerobaculia bacterium]|nr:VCBS repeat-containing protein [Thermoanaerobaculia bacterium]